jgi:hypothetical protein
MFFIEDNNFLNSEQKHFVDNFLLGSNFPYFLNYNIDHQHSYLVHTFMIAPEDRKKDQPEFNSKISPIFVKLLDNFCKNNKLTYKKILRCALNLTFSQKVKKSEPHLDHSYEHKTLLIYLNDNDGNTVILDKKNKIWKKVKPKKYKGVCFPYRYHYQFYPKSGIRAVAVYTFI